MVLPLTRSALSRYARRLRDFDLPCSLAAHRERPIFASIISRSARYKNLASDSSYAHDVQCFSAKHGYRFGSDDSRRKLSFAHLRHARLFFNNSTWPPTPYCGSSLQFSDSSKRPSSHPANSSPITLENDTPSRLAWAAAIRLNSAFKEIVTFRRSSVTATVGAFAGALEVLRSIARGAALVDARALGFVVIFMTVTVARIYVNVLRSHHDSGRSSTRQNQHARSPRIGQEKHSELESRRQAARGLRGNRRDDRPEKGRLPRHPQGAGWVSARRAQETFVVDANVAVNAFAPEDVFTPEDRITARASKAFFNEAASHGAKLYVPPRFASEVTNVSSG